MLNLLHIENIAVIERADIRFHPGFNVLTGETGAGKSIVIDAICAILGERAYRDVIRTGASSAFVSAVFDHVPLLPWFEENGVEYQEDELLIQRELFLDGKNACRVNGRPVSVAILKKLGSALIHIHGQHDSQQLFDEQSHLAYLDLFAQNRDLINDYLTQYRLVEEIDRQIGRLSMDESEKLRKMEMLKFQISEIEKAQLQPGEDHTLEARRRMLQNAEKLTDSLIGSVSALYGDEDRQGSVDLLSAACKDLSKVTRFDDTLQQLHEKLTDLSYSVQDVAEQLRDKIDQLSYSGDELEQIEARLDVIHRLKRKYGSDVEEILQFLENAKQELDQIEFSDARLEKLKTEKDRLLSVALEKAAQLHRSRTAAAVLLEKRLSEELTALDMANARFVCQFDEIPLSDNGTDHVRFLMSANIGEDLKPMNKVASGGELARIMLAIKNVLAQQDDVATLIFDEVDAGVSGRAAQKVAEKLRQVSSDKQVLCVTHLPQIAAQADVHMLIEKQEQDGRTYTHVTELDREGRKMEIARIIGGAQITSTTLKSAEEMLLP